MPDQEKLISLRCVFCESTQLEVPEDYQPKEGDVLKCAGCGRDNPFELLMDAAREEGMELAKNIIEKELSKVKFK